MVTYTTSNRFEKQVTNSNRDAWGENLNVRVIDMVDAAMDGIVTLSMTGNVTLTTENGAADQARKRVINITSTGGANRTITIPAVEKYYVVRNAGAQYVTIKTAAGTGVIALPGVSICLFCDGTDCYKVSQFGMGLISNTAFTGGSPEINITLTGFDCTDFRLVLKGLSLNSSTQPIYLSVSVDGSTYSNTSTTMTTGLASVAVYGNIDAFGTNAASGFLLFSAGDLGSNLTTITAPSYSVDWRSSSGINYIRISSPVAFDAGSVDLYGR